MTLRTLFRNDGPGPTFFRVLGYLEQVYVIDVVREGVAQPRTRWGDVVIQDPGGPHGISVGAGEEWALALRLNALFDMTEPGRYVVQLRKRVRTHVPEGNCCDANKAFQTAHTCCVEVVSNRVTIDVEEP